MCSSLRAVAFFAALRALSADEALDALEANATDHAGSEAAVEVATASVRGLLRQSGVSVLSWHSIGSETPPPNLLDAVFPGMGLLGLDVDEEPVAPASNNAGADTEQNEGNNASPPRLEADAIVSHVDSHEEAPMTMAERLKRLRAQRVAEAEGVSEVAGGAAAHAGASAVQPSPLPSSGADSGDSDARLLESGEWASAADVDSRGNYSHPRPNQTLDVAKFAWLHFPKAGTSFANTLVSWGCPRLQEDDIVDNRTADGSGAYVWGFMGTHKKQCREEFSICGGHAPIKEGGCNAWEKHSGNFVALFRQPEQRIISGFNQNCHDVAGDNCTLTGYSKKVAGCSVKMMNGQDCGAEVPVTADMVTTAIQRLDTGFAFVGLTEQWALSVCLFHAMFGGQCHDREFLNVRPGKKHAVMRYDTHGLEGWTDAFDGVVYSHASTIFRNNIAKYGVSPDTCRQDFCSNSAEAFEMALFTEQR